MYNDDDYNALYQLMVLVGLVTFLTIMGIIAHYGEPTFQVRSFEVVRYCPVDGEVMQWPCKYVPWMTDV